MQPRRFLRHAATVHWGARLAFPRSTLDAIEKAIGLAERAHGGEIRFAIETALPPLRVLDGVSPRARALEVFSHLRVWDTEHNNGVLIYVLLADRAVEIVADRGLSGRIAPAEWESVCRLMEQHFRARRFEVGSLAGVDAVGTLLARHFPASQRVAGPAHNELPDRPALL